VGRPKKALTLATLRSLLAIITPTERELAFYRHLNKVAWRQRPRCGARTRQGRPCLRRAECDPYGIPLHGGKCRNHGGLSTGPRTPEGHARCAAGRAAARLRNGSNSD